MANPPSLAALKNSAAELDRRYGELKAAGMSLDMTRGKPSPEQLDLALDMATVLGSKDYRAADGTDCRNYGGIDGLPEAKSLFAEFLEVTPKEDLVGDN